MANNKLVDLAISRIPGISLREKILLSEKLDASNDFSVLSNKENEIFLRRGMKSPFPVMDTFYKEAEHIAETAKRRGISWVSYSEKDYPPLLRETIDAPLVIFYRGMLPNPELMLVGMVGTRNPSALAIAEAYDIAKDLGNAGIPVVSGLALGIDAMCHRGNLEGGAPTVAVLGSAVDMIYPVANRMIAAKILDHGGCIMSEYAPGTKPARWQFPARNRIISGLSRGLIVVEAPEKSGALISAQFALEQGRDIWVAPSGLSETYGKGTMKLHEDGAPILHNIKMLFDEWNISVEHHEESDRSFSGESLAAGLARSLNIKI
ncbi:MAG: DNA-processing protein DprA [Treponema sp.]|jgi:DNA processing protein|nr:DNA-processing protein DprA [Treponema sp.]